jgi:hypothetical protein
LPKTLGTGHPRTPRSWMVLKPADVERAGTRAYERKGMRRRQCPACRATLLRQGTSRPASRARILTSQLSTGTNRKARFEVDRKRSKPGATGARLTGGGALVRKSSNAETI